MCAGGLHRKPAEGIRSPRTEVIGSYESPSLCGGNQTHVLWVHALNHWGSTLALSCRILTILDPDYEGKLPLSLFSWQNRWFLILSGSGQLHSPFLLRIAVYKTHFLELLFHPSGRNLILFSMNQVFRCPLCVKEEYSYPEVQEGENSLEPPTPAL